VWIAGVCYFFFAPGGAKLRFFAWTYVLLLAMMILSQASRPDRIGAMYTVLFAAGAVAIEEVRRPILRRSTAGLTIAILACGILLAAPITTPLLSPPVLTKYLSAIGFAYDVERGKMSEPIPQWLADRLGWKELATDVARVFHSLSPEEQRNTVIVSTNYGEAGSLELFGPELGLPHVYATHNNYFLWGPPPDSVKTYIGVFVDRRGLERRFESVVEAALHTCEECTRPQRRIPIYLARIPTLSIEKEWPSFKIYD